MSSCAICLENNDNRTQVSIPSCGHRFCQDCIFRWAKTKEQPLCPLCFAHFNSVTSDDGVETSVMTRTRETRPSDDGMSGLDQSFFLGDIQRLLQRCTRLQRCLPRASDQLQDILVLLHSHRLQLVHGRDFVSSELMLELSSLDRVVTNIEEHRQSTVSAVEPVNRRRYGANDAESMSSDEEIETEDDFVCGDAVTYDRLRRLNTRRPIQRPSKSIENISTNRRHRSKKRAS